ncbi:hypothetical protein BH10PLA2_BH10PLA2_08500 [soil metagenome]
MSVEPTSLAPRKRNRPWLWYFVLLIVLSITAVVIQIWYARGRLLTLDKLQVAEQKWREHGPQNYNLNYSYDKSGGKDEYHVEVRGGKVVSVTRNGQPLEERLYRYSSVPALFGFAEDYLRQDQEDMKLGKGRPYAFGDFHPQLGYVRRFVHGGRLGDRVEIVTDKFTPVDNP